MRNFKEKSALRWKPGTVERQQKEQELKDRFNKLVERIDYKYFLRMVAQIEGIALVPFEHLVKRKGYQCIFGDAEDTRLDFDEKGNYRRISDGKYYHRRRRAGVDFEKRPGTAAGPK